ncbi:hypothetical protein COCNU_scaffold019103G000020 [Cocos nucifera]|nr:hypothetical protein [Cocos nucifera]
MPIRESNISQQHNVSSPQPLGYLLIFESTSCFFYEYPIGYDRFKAFIEEKVRKANARARAAKEEAAEEIRKAAKKAKRVIEEIAWLKTELLATIES